MRSPLEVEIAAIWSYNRLLAEAANERLARQLPRRSSKPIRVRLAAVLYALANWLSAEVPASSVAGKALKTA